MLPQAVVFGFLGSAAVVVLAGTVLARAGDVIAARTRLGGLWVGALFLAVATSLPELATDIAAVRLGEPDLAVGDLFGSGLANMLILALVSLSPRVGLYEHAALDNGLAAALAMGLTALAAVLVLLDAQPAVAGMGAGSLVLAAAYVVGMRAVYRRSRTAQAVVAREETVGEGTRPPTLRAAALRFAAASVAILAAAPVFARSASALAELTGLGTTVVGTLLVGLATSLPELVTSLAAVRLRAYDLAVGNLFGSNAVNMLLLVPVDLVAPGPPLLDTVGDAHALTALVGIGMMAVGLGAIVARSHGRMRSVEPASLLMLAVYAAGSGLLYLRGAAP